MKWVSPEVKQYYTMFNTVYSTLLKNYHPYLKLIYIDPFTFNNTFYSEDEYKNHTVNVIMCTSFGEEYREITKNRSLGEDVSVFFTDFKKMVPGDEKFMNKRMYPAVQINKTRYCKGIVKYHDK